MRIPSRVLDIDLPPFDPLNIRAAELRAEGHHVVSLGQALPFFPPPPSALRAAEDAKVLDTSDMSIDAAIAAAIAAVESHANDR